MSDAIGAMTPRPWRADHNYISGADVQIAKCGGNLSDKAMAYSHARWSADAAHIVRCVNAFDEMKAALEAVAHALTLHGHIEADTDLHQRIDAALALTSAWAGRARTVPPSPLTTGATP